MAAQPGEGLGDDPVERVAVRVSAAKRGARAFWALAGVAVDYKWSLHGFESTKTDEYKEALSACHKRAADRLLELCHLQAGVYIKAGQHISSFRPFIPQEYTSTLSTLHDDAPRSEEADVRRVFREEIGMELDQAFAEFDPVPLGCASLAQVHKARLRPEGGEGGEGRQVAVKVQHAWMSQHTRSDLQTIRWMAMAIERLFSGISVMWMMPLFRVNLNKELDFRLEHANAERCAANFDGDSSVYVPAVINGLCSARVLTMEYIDGVKVDDKQALSAGGFDQGEVSSIVAEVFGKMVFEHGFIHCDPHPGNLLVRRAPGGGRTQVVVLDHGLYREIGEGMRLSYCALWEALILRDKALLDRVAADLGVPEHGNLFPLILTNRGLASNTRLGETMTKEERRRVASTLPREFRREGFDWGTTVGKALGFVEALPRDLLFILRTQTLVRALCSDLGYPPRKRFRLYARLAAANSRTTRGLGRLRGWFRSVRWEATMLFMEVIIWATTTLHVSWIKPPLLADDDTAPKQ